MKRAFIYLVIGVATYGVVASLFGLAPFRGSPTFYRSVATEGRTYSCAGADGSAIFVRFENDGRLASVRAGRYDLRLPYKASDFATDIYKLGAWRLALDPEANRTGPSSIRFASCS